MEKCPFTKDNDYVYINRPYAEAYIPYDLFGDPSVKSCIAYYYGSGIKTIGIFHIRVFEDENTPREEVPIRTLNYPNMIETYPSSIETETVEIDGVKTKYNVLKYQQGDILMNAFSNRSSHNCEAFLNLMTSGRMPKSITYDDVIKVWIKNFQINDFNPGVPALLMQLIISVMYRYSKDPSLEFRKVAGKKGFTEFNDYIQFNMNEVSSYSSVMSALSFERFADKMVTSLQMTIDGTEQKKSPIEKVLSM